MSATTVFVGIDIEKAAFIPVMEVIHKLEGVAKVHLDFDKMFERRRKAATNGAAAPPRSRPPKPSREHGTGLKDLILAALFEGPKPRSELAAMAEAGGFVAASTDTALHELKKRGMIAKANGVHSLTPEARSAMAAYTNGSEPAKALPAPEAEAAPEKPAEKPAKPMPAKRQAMRIAMDVLCSRESATPLKFIQTPVAEANLPDKALQNALGALARDKLISRVGDALYAPTAKGRRQHANSGN